MVFVEEPAQDLCDGGLAHEQGGPQSFEDKVV